MKKMHLARFSLPALSWLAAATVAATAFGQNVATVQEDWQLVVNQPDVNLNGPQVTCVIAPTPDPSGCYCAFDINYCTQSVYSAGGLQMHFWSPTWPIIVTSFPGKNGLLMQTTGETVTWTTVMAANSGTVTFQVVNGQSTTWGNFGGANESITTPNIGVNNLNGYDYNFSLNNSGVSFASNLVTSLTLMDVRAYDSNGNLIGHLISSPQVVHPQD